MKVNVIDVPKDSKYIITLSKELPSDIKENIHNAFKRLLNNETNVITISKDTVELTILKDNN